MFCMVVLRYCKCNNNNESNIHWSSLNDIENAIYFLLSDALKINELSNLNKIQNLQSPNILCEQN